jgi:hypothetical protein
MTPKLNGKRPELPLRALPVNERTDYADSVTVVAL